MFFIRYIIIIIFLFITLFYNQIALCQLRNDQAVITDDYYLNSLYESGMMFFKNGNYFNAMNQCKKFINIVPKSNLSDDCFKVIVISSIELDDVYETCNNFNIASNLIVDQDVLADLSAEIKQYLLKKQIAFTTTIDIGTKDTRFSEVYYNDSSINERAINELMPERNSNSDKAIDVLYNNFLSSGLYASIKRVFDIKDDKVIKNCIRENLNLGDIKGTVVHSYTIDHTDLRYSGPYRDLHISVKFTQPVNFEFKIQSCLY